MNSDFLNFIISLMSLTVTLLVVNFVITWFKSRIVCCIYLGVIFGGGWLIFDLPGGSLTTLSKIHVSITKIGLEVIEYTGKFWIINIKRGSNHEAYIY